MGNRLSGKYAKSLALLLEAKLDGRSGVWLAEKSGVSQSKVSRLLNEIGDIDMTDAEKIANAFDQCGPLVFLAEVYGRADELRLLRAFSRARSREERDSVLRQVESMVGDDRESRPSRKMID